MSTLLKKLAIFPDKILASAALRTQQTAQGFAKILNYPLEEIVLHQSMYEAATRTVLNLINQLDDKDEVVFVVGHNPTFSDLPAYLTGESYYHLPTCGIVNINFDTSHWAEISEGTGETIWFKYPKIMED